MSQTFKGDKGIYKCGREIGKGGEGSVYEVENDDKLVLKIYSESLSANKVKKLKMMSASGTSQLEGYIAWVKDVVSDSSGRVCGFTMKKLVNYYPLHTLFGPMDRKKTFPDKGYNFLVHVARNLATAFHVCHANGHVIGDVNEGNILVNSQGMIMLIDCDSFQISEGTNYYFCEVGIPRYTSPELLSKTTFSEVVRTVNTDSFSLAVIIFQLLFMGRHPFAGINKSNIDIDEELAIKNHWFAYSVKNNSKTLLPPKDSYSINYVRQSLKEMFHNSFELIANRPKPVEWVRELGFYLSDLIACKKSKVHFYASWLNLCPWCDFAESKNILYFLDDNNLDQAGTLNNIENFVNGFKVATFNFPILKFPSAFPDNIVAKPIDPVYSGYKWKHRISVSIPVIIGLCMISITPWTIGIGIFFSLVLYYNLPWMELLQEESTSREINLKNIRRQLESAIKEYNSPKGIEKYNFKASRLLNTIDRIKMLPNDFQNQKKEVEEKIYNNQLQRFLQGFEIRDYEIPSFGASRKQDLWYAGIKNAADISKLKSIKIQGIGPTFEATLYGWRRQISSKFVYHPDLIVLRTEYNKIATQIEQTKKQSENELKNEYREMEVIRIGINSQQAQLKKFIDTSIITFFQAYMDNEAFKKLN